MMPDHEPWLAKTELTEQCAELHREEIEAANEAVRRALASYRWWSFSSLTSRLRMLVTRAKLFFGMKLWP